jgi:hypothetical protein
VSAPLSVNARAVLRWIERCGGRLDRHAIEDEFISRRAYWPNDALDAIHELIEAGEVIESDDGEVVALREAVE